MISRQSYAHELELKLSAFPIVAILGPRQCGKTTFIKEALPTWTYQDLERPMHRTPLEADIEGRLRSLGDHVIFDEAQQFPALFSMLRTIVDERKMQNGGYVLLGSTTPALVRSISESLAGRCAFIDMTGFSWNEVSSFSSLQDLWLRGGFPVPFLQDNDTLRSIWFEGYERTFIERDINQMGVGVTASVMRRLLLMTAHVNARQWNATEIANALGVNYQTVNRYADILEQAFLIRRLLPYAANIGKRLTKRPRLMFRDSGLLHFLLGITKLSDLDANPARGFSWESFLTEQIICIARTHSHRAEPYFWRTSGGAEVDLLLSIDSHLVPIEFKLHSAPSPPMARGLIECMKDLNLKRGFILNPGTQRYSLGHGIEVIPANEFLGMADLLSI